MRSHRKKASAATDPVVEAIERFVSGIKALASRHGAPEKYHETITWAYLLLTHERMGLQKRDHTWEYFANANADLLDWNSSVLRKYYSPATLDSNLARRVFVLPDRCLEAPDLLPRSRARTGLGPR